MSWDVVAIDEASAESMPGDTWRFYVDTENTVPTTPMLIRPTQGEIISDYQPTLEARGSQDEDGDDVSYVFMIRTIDGELVTQSEAISESDSDSVSWLCDVELAEDRGYVAAVHALDF
jgi:hypothetical protein